MKYNNKYICQCSLCVYFLLPLRYYRCGVCVCSHGNVQYIHTVTHIYALCVCYDGIDIPI